MDFVLILDLATFVGVAYLIFAGR